MYFNPTELFFKMTGIKAEHWQYRLREYPLAAIQFALELCIYGKKYLNHNGKDCCIEHFLEEKRSTGIIYPSTDMGKEFTNFLLPLSKPLDTTVKPETSSEKYEFVDQKLKNFFIYTDSGKELLKQDIFSINDTGLLTSKFPYSPFIEIGYSAETSWGSPIDCLSRAIARGTGKLSTVLERKITSKLITAGYGISSLQELLDLPGRNDLAKEYFLIYSTGKSYPALNPVWDWNTYYPSATSHSLISNTKISTTIIHKCESHFPLDTGYDYILVPIQALDISMDIKYTVETSKSTNYRRRFCITTFDTKYLKLDVTSKENFVEKPPEKVSPQKDRFSNLLST